MRASDYSAGTEEMGVFNHTGTGPSSYFPRPMNIQIRHETVDDLEEYGQVPMVFTVRSRYRVELVDGGLGGWFLNEEPAHPPYEKDYDELEPPTRWLKHDTSRWTVFAAYDGGRVSATGD